MEGTKKYIVGLSVALSMLPFIVSASPTLYDHEPTVLNDDFSFGGGFVAEDSGVLRYAQAYLKNPSGASTTFHIFSSFHTRYLDCVSSTTAMTTSYELVTINFGGTECDLIYVGESYQINEVVGVSTTAWGNATTSEIWLRVYDIDDELLAGGTDTSTRFISFVPVLGTGVEVATSTSFEFTVTGFVSDEDFAEGEIELQMNIPGITTGEGFFLDMINDQSWTWTIPSAGYFSTTSLVSVLDTGAYEAWYRLRRPRVPVLNLYKTYVQVFGVFLVGSGSDVSQEEIDLADLRTQAMAIFGAPTFPTGSDATSTLLDMSKAFSLREAVMVKFPINWILESSAILSNFASSTATTTIPDVSVDFTGTWVGNNLATTTAVDLDVPLFSASVLDSVGNNAGIQLMRTLVSYSLWIGLLFYAWRRGRSLFYS